MVERLGGHALEKTNKQVPLWPENACELGKNVRYLRWGQMNQRIPCEDAVQAPVCYVEGAE